jgi:hypothetical protein
MNNNIFDYRKETEVGVALQILYVSGYRYAYRKLELFSEILENKNTSQFTYLLGIEKIIFQR